jgi:integrase
MNIRYAEKKQKELDKYLASYGRLSNSMRKDLRAFDSYNKQRSISVSTRNNYVRFMAFFSDWIASKGKKEYREVTQKDFEGYFTHLEGKSLAYINWCKLAIKVFYRWELNKDKSSKQYPKVVDWIRLKREKWKEIPPNELITKEDVEKLLDVCGHPRDKCLIVMLWESGCRRGEIMGLRLKDINFKDDECWIHVSGKTGERDVLLFDSVPFLKQLIEVHPLKEKPEAYLFLNKTKGKHLNRPYHPDSFYIYMNRLAKKAKIGKPCNPHRWRHAAATRWSREGYNEEEAKLRFGWTRQSSTPARYTHLSQSDLAKRMRVKMGKAEAEAVEANGLKGRICPSCRRKNEISSKKCAFCGYILDEELASQVKIMKELLGPTFELMKKDNEDLRKELHELKQKVTS